MCHINIFLYFPSKISYKFIDLLNIAAVVVNQREGENFFGKSNQKIKKFVLQHKHAKNVVTIKL
jgi:hypothetical protein